LDLLRDTGILLLSKVEVWQLHSLEVRVVEGVAGTDALAGLINKHALQQVDAVVVDLFRFNPLAEVLLLVDRPPDLVKFRIRGYALPSLLSRQAHNSKYFIHLVGLVLTLEERVLDG
jgi:hypothetical protein